MRTLSIVSFLSVAALAGAQPLGQVSVGDLPGTNGRWQMGEVTVAAPADEVQRWFSDAPRWPQRFPDDEYARVVGRAPDGRLVVEFKSKILGRAMTLHLRDQRGLITYDGVGKGINTQGKIMINALGPNQTRIVMQTTGELHGLVGVFGKGEKRKRALAKLRSDLDACARLARASAAAPRSGG